MTEIDGISVRHEKAAKVHAIIHCADTRAELLAAHSPNLSLSEAKDYARTTPMLIGLTSDFQLKQKRSLDV